jgi:hypothetical protein
MKLKSKHSVRPACSYTSTYDSAGAERHALEFVNNLNTCIEALCSIGDLRVAESLINWLFKEGSDYCNVANIKNIFGDYTDLILKASLKGGRFRSQSDEAVCELCKIRTKISSNILHKITQKEDYEIVDDRWDIDEPTPCVYAYSFESQRDAARTELERRGNPVYDSSAYLEREAWKL